MNVLIAYATNSGSTMAASELVEQELKNAGQTVTRKEIHEIAPDEIGNFDLVVFGSPSWEVGGMDGQPHEHFIQFIASLKGKSYPGKKCAIFGLGDRSYPKFCGAVDHLEQMVRDMGATLIIPSTRVDGYYFNQEQNEEQLKKWASQLPH